MKFRKFVAYAGGQKGLLPLLLELIPAHEKYVEIFGGGCTLLFNKNISKFEVYNDVNRNLTNLFKVIRDRTEEFKEQLKFLPQNRALFQDFKRELIKETDDLQKALKFYYLLTYSFSGVTHRYSFVVKESSKIKSAPSVDWFAQRLRNVVIENLDFAELIEKYDSPQTFFFLDPPYADIEDLYEFSFKDDDHVRLFETLRKIKGHFLMTYNDHPFIDLLYRNYFKFTYDTPMMMSLKKTNMKVNHLIIADYDILTRTFRPFMANFFEF